MAEREKRSTQVDRVPTLGEMAEVMEAWKAVGVTRESTMYVVDQVFWETPPALTQEQRDRIAAMKAEVRSALRQDVPTEHDDRL